MKALVLLPRPRSLDEVAREVAAALGPDATPAELVDGVKRVITVSDFRRWEAVALERDVLLAITQAGAA